MFRTVKRVEILGPSKTGKSSLLHYLERTFGAKYPDLNVRFIEDLIRQAPPQVDEINKNLWVLARLNIIMIELESEAPDLIVIERGKGAVCASLKAFLDTKGYIVERKRREEVTKVIEYERKLLTKEIDFFILFDVEPELAICRDKRDGQLFPGKIINLEFQTTLRRAYHELRENVLPLRHLKLMDGNLDLEKDATKIAACRMGIVEKLAGLVYQRKEEKN